MELNAVAGETPEPIVTLDLRALRTFVTNDEGDLVVVASDGDITVSFEPGVGGDWASAMNNAEKAAETFLAYTELMKLRCGERRPLARSEPPINALG